MTRISFTERITKAGNAGAAEQIIEEAFADCAKVLTRAVRSYHHVDLVFLAAAMELTSESLRASLGPAAEDAINTLKKRCTVVQIQA